MESTQDNSMFEVAEIQVSYKLKVKAYFALKLKCRKMLMRFSESTRTSTRSSWWNNSRYFLNRANRVIGIYEALSSTSNGTVVDPKSVFGAAIKVNASAVVLAHNYPSGSLMPSQADIKLTKDMVAAGKFLTFQCWIM